MVQEMNPPDGVDGVDWRIVDSSEWDVPGQMEPDEVGDQRCPDCGRWFELRGLDSHRESCELRELPWFVFDEESGQMWVPTCPQCEGALYPDVPIDEQDGRHRRLCPHRSDSPL